MSFIPGMTGAVAMTESVPPSLSSVSVVGSNYSESSNSVAYPVIAFEEGDVALFFDYCTRSGGSNPTNVTPTGFTQLQTDTEATGEGGPPDFGRARASVSYRIMDGTESGNVIGMSHNYEGKFILIVRGDIPITSVVLAGHSHEGGVNPASYQIPSGDGDPPLLVVGWAVRDDAPSVFTQNSPAFQTLIDDPTKSILGYTVYNSAPADHTIDSDMGGGLYASLSGMYFEFS